MHSGCARLTTFNIMFLMIDCSCKIDYKMKLIGNYTWSRTWSRFVFGEIIIIPLVLRTRGILNISPNTHGIFH
jgi:hypothetical protein